LWLYFFKEVVAERIVIMTTQSKIEWTEHTWNPVTGCDKISPGCANCYAETLSKRWGNDVWGNDKPRKMIKSAFPDLDKFQKIAHEAGEIQRVFVGSMMDIFEKPILALAPMVGVSDLAYRALCKKYGADLVYTEMISSDALIRKAEKNCK